MALHLGVPALRAVVGRAPGGVLKRRRRRLHRGRAVQVETTSKFKRVLKALGFST